MWEDDGEGDGDGGDNGGDNDVDVYLNKTSTKYQVYHRCL